MGGYKFHHKFRFTPANGNPSVMDIQTAFLDIGGPTRTTLDYAMDQDVQTDVNRGRQVLFRGFRPVVRIDFEIFSMADQTNFATIVNRLCSPDWTVELSLDGGVIYREVVLDRLDGPTALAGKTFVGAAYTMTVSAVDLVEEYPDINFNDGGTRYPDVYGW